MRIVFMGTPAAAAVSLQRLVDDGHEIVAVYTQPDRPSGRGNKITFSAVKQLALDNGLPLIQPKKVKTPEALAEFCSFNADVAVVVAYGRILPLGFLNAFPHGAINVHFSLLPKYRGAAPVNWAIVNGETITGVTTMKMDDGLDTGHILLQSETAIGEGENSVSLMSRLGEIGAELLSKTLTNLPSIEPVEQDHSRATNAPIMTKQDGRFEWSFSAQRIERMVRGFQPFPTTFTNLEEKRFTIWDCAIRDGVNGARPGTVIAAAADALDVACGDETALSIREVQIEGKRRMHVRDFLNGVNIPLGEVLKG